MGFQFCPHCGKKMPPEEAGEKAPLAAESVATARTYDGPKYWRSMIERSQLNRHLPLDSSRAIKRILEESLKAPTLDGIVHLIMDRDMVPSGGVFLRAAQMLSGPNATVAGPSQEERDQFLRQRGYVVNDGHVTTVNDIPVGQAYLLLEEWGGKEHFGDWNMSAPIDLQPSRSGNPFFFDENMIAFGVHFSRRDDIEAAFEVLFARFKTDGVGGLVDIGVFWQ